MRRLGFVVLLVSGLVRADTATNALAPEVRVLVDRWLAAQNAGDFAAYQAFYAARFTGVRRSGPRVVRFDRAGWIKDRQRMFGKKMSVAADSLAISSSPSSARATFVQSFEQGAYRDRGDKQLVLVREGGTLKIAQEEMLSSSVGDRKTASASPLEQFAWVVDGGIVLDDAPGDVGRGKFTFESSAITTLSRGLDPKQLGADVLAWKGRKVIGFDAAGARCDATVKGFKLVGKVTPHFSTEHEWRDQPEQKAAREAWELAGKVLVGVLDGCADATWARAAELPVPAIVGAHHPDDEVRALALKKFRALPEWKTIQTSYLEQPARGVARWEEFPDGRSGTEVHAFDVMVSGKPVTLVSVTSAVAQGCADFAGDLWALYELGRKGGKPALTLRNTPGNGTVTPAGFVDTDGDGVPEILFEGGAAGDLGTERGRVKPANGKWDELEKLSWPFLDCPC